MKRTAKALAEALATLTVLPAFAHYQLGKLMLGSRKAFPGWSQFMSLVPGLTGAYVRRAFYRLVFVRCGSGTWISFGTVFSHPCGTNAPCIVISFMWRVQMSNESGALDVPW